MKNKYVYIDFEFNQTQEKYLNLVSCSYSLSDNPTKKVTSWLHNNEASKSLLKKELEELIDKGYIFVAWSVTAEAGSFISLGINPLKAKWYDLYLEYRLVTNHLHKYQYGKQLIDGKVKFTTPKSMYSSDEDDSSKPQHNLASASYKLLGKMIDTDHKDKIRALIISNPPSFTKQEMIDILNYNESDIDLLPELQDKFLDIYLKDFPRRHLGRILDEALGRGEFSARTAIMEREGYPINVEWARNFYSHSQKILNDIIEEINTLFPHISPFEYDKRNKRYVRKESRIFKWIEEESGLANEWAKTDGGKSGIKKYSLKTDILADYYPYRHNYPKDNLGAQLTRLLKTKQSLAGFLPPPPTAKNKSTIFDALGSDGRIRCFFGIFGSQSARSQPKSTYFIPLKSAFIRALIQPKKGRAIAGLDYSSQEFLLKGLGHINPSEYKDTKMLDAYESGDVYFYFAKLAKAVAWDAKREDHEDIRDLFKSTTLGLSYLMTKHGLSRKLTQDTGKLVTKDDAQEFIDKFNEAFKDQAEANDKIKYFYERNGYLRLPDGWILFGDNDNFRSVCNFPIQGLGSSILRKAIALAQDAGLTVIYSLHDAIYIEYDADDLSAIDTLERCMREAFVFYFKGTEVEDKANLIRLDGKAWSPDYTDGVLVTPKGMKVEAQNIHIDKRAKDDYKQFSKYFFMENNNG